MEHEYTPLVFTQEKTPKVFWTKPRVLGLLGAIAVVFVVGVATGRSLNSHSIGVRQNTTDTAKNATSEEVDTEEPEITTTAAPKKVIQAYANFLLKHENRFMDTKFITKIGDLTFTQVEGEPTRIEGQIGHLAPGSVHGIRIHELGKFVTSCLDTGDSYNPFGRNHGGPHDSERHVGDLGNVEANIDGVAKVNISDPVIQLNGPYTIIGRSIVIYKGPDDLGKGGDDESLKTGNVGGRLACGVIGVSSKDFQPEVVKLIAVPEVGGPPKENIPETKGALKNSGFGIVVALSLVFTLNML